MIVIKSPVNVEDTAHNRSFDEANEAQTRPVSEASTQNNVARFSESGISTLSLVREPDTPKP